MRTLLKLLLPIGVSAIAVTAAFGQFRFDENGNGFGPGGPIPGVIGIDPLTGTNALCYQLGFFTAPGDVLLTESGAQSNVFSYTSRFRLDRLRVRPPAQL